MGLGEGGKIIKQTFNIPDSLQSCHSRANLGLINHKFANLKKYTLKVGDCVKMQYKKLYSETFCLIDKVLNGIIFAKKRMDQRKKRQKRYRVENSNFVFTIQSKKSHRRISG